MKLKDLCVVQFVQFVAAMAVVLPFYVLPRQIAFRLGEWLGEAIYHVMPRRRAIGYKNLTIAFGETLSDAEKRRILRATFRNLGKSLVETLHFPKMRKEELLEKVTIVGHEHYLAAKRKGKGVICLTGHCGNWEIGPHAYSAAGNPAKIVVRPLDNPFLDQIVARLRTMYGNTLITSRNSLKQIIAALKNQELVGLLMDQNTTHSAGIFVDFFGKPACTVPVIAILALRYGVPVIPGFTVRTGFDTHRLAFGPEIDITRTGDLQKDIEVNTAHFNEIIADFICQYPDQWFWIHNRWKTQPR